MKSISMRWLAWPAIAAVVALLAVWTSPTQVTHAQAVNGMEAVGPGANVAVGNSFDVDINFTDADTAWAGYKGYLQWDNTIVDDAVPPVVTNYNLGCLVIFPAPTEKVNGVQFGGACMGVDSNSVGKVATIELACLAPGTSVLHLVTPVEDPAFGNTHLDLGGAPITTVLVDGTVTCEEQSDLELVKTGPATALAGDTIEYTLTVHNAGPSAAKGVIIGDDLPDDKVFLDAFVDLDGDTVPDFPCVPGWVASYPLDEDGDTLIDEDPVDTVDNDGDTLIDEDPPNLNIVQCVIDGPLTGLPPVAPSQTIIVTILVDVPLEAAGKLEINTAAVFCSDAGGVPDPTVDPNPANDADGIGTLILPSDISIVKSADRDPAVYSEGEEILWDIVATVNGPSPASDVVLSDTVGANQEITYCFALVTPPPPDMVWPCTCVIAPDLKSCDCDCTGMAIEAGGSIGMAVDADVVGSAGNLCVDDAEVCWADPLCDSAHAEAVCLPPTVRMEKDLDEDATLIVDTTNLFLEMGPDGLECLTVYELVSNAGNDPDGVGAYEFQLKFDHKIFDITIEDSSWLSNEGARVVDCTMTIISENDIRFGCVSSGPVPGQMDDGTAAIITVCPEPDLVNRLTPGQDNGLFEILLDENCELADVLGDPLRIPIGSLAPGVLPGGILEVCSDMSITVRILEADLNLDCVVDVLDEQAIAFRYGAFFGNLLYDPWYDLEPWNKDFDIDIKDLQKVFGRDGSTCAVPIPPQDPLPAPPW